MGSPTTGAAVGMGSSMPGLSSTALFDGGGMGGGMMPRLRRHLRRLDRRWGRARPSACRQILPLAQCRRMSHRSWATHPMSSGSPLASLGTAGCGKSVVATRFAESAIAAGKRVLLVCFNRPLAERIKMSVPKGVYVDTFYGLMDKFLISRGHKLSYDRIGEPDFWLNVQERVIGETIGSDWKFDALIVDEGQDFERQWSEILQLFLNSNADILWLEDLGSMDSSGQSERSWLRECL